MKQEFKVRTLAPASGSRELAVASTKGLVTEDIIFNQDLTYWICVLKQVQSYGLSSNYSIDPQAHFPLTWASQRHSLAVSLCYAQRLCTWRNGLLPLRNGNRRRRVVHFSLVLQLANDPTRRNWKICRSSSCERIADLALVYSPPSTFRSILLLESYRRLAQQGLSVRTQKTFPCWTAPIICPRSTRHLSTAADRRSNR